jgi:hypothetical protein
MELREQIAEEIVGYGYDIPKRTRLEIAEDISNIPDIQKALSLLELYKQGKLVKLADEQVKPSVPTTWGRCQQHDAYALAQHDMEIIGFKRVETL